MGNLEKPQFRPPQRRTVEARKPAATSTDKSSLGSAVTESIKSAVFEKRPYLKFAFSNPYNLSLLGGALAAAGITMNPFLALIALGLEGLWLLHAPESKRLKHILWDPRFAKVRLEIERRERAERMKGLSEDQKYRVESLVARQQDINTLAAQNPSFTGDLLRNELVKTGRLVDSFVEMALTTGRYEQYLESVDIQGVEKDRQRWEREVRAGQNGDPQTELAKKNLAILLKRLEKMNEIKRYLTLARGQLDLIENSFQLIADQIVTMQSPNELSGQLNELLDGVESIKESAADTEKFLKTLEI